MGTLFALLDQEWSQLAGSTELADATRDILDLADGAATWNEGHKWMRSSDVHPARKNRVLEALVHRATLDADQGSARLALAMLMPGISVELNRHSRRRNARGLSASERDAVAVEIVWRLIRTYPTRRRGNVAANILLDLRKELCVRPTSVAAVLAEAGDGRAKDSALEAIDHRSNDVSALVADAVEAQRLNDEDAELILDICVRGIACKDAASRRSMPERTFRRRQRAAETRLASHAREEFAA